MGLYFKARAICLILTEVLGQGGGGGSRKAKLSVMVMLKYWKGDFHKTLQTTESLPV